MLNLEPKGTVSLLKYSTISSIRMLRAPLDVQQPLSELLVCSYVVARHRPPLLYRSRTYFPYSRSTARCAGSSTLPYSLGIHVNARHDLALPLKAQVMQRSRTYESTVDTTVWTQ
jgi:hypothetical protein